MSAVTNSKRRVCAGCEGEDNELTEFWHEPLGESVFLCKRGRGYSSEPKADCLGKWLKTRSIKCCLCGVGYERFGAKWRDIDEAAAHAWPVCLDCVTLHNEAKAGAGEKRDWYYVSMFDATHKLASYGRTKFGEKGRAGDLLLQMLTGSKDWPRSAPTGTCINPRVKGEAFSSKNTGDLDLRITPVQAEALTEFLELLNESLDAKYEAGREVGQNLLVQLSRGEISTAKFDAEVKTHGEEE